MASTDVGLAEGEKVSVADGAAVVSACPLPHDAAARHSTRKTTSGSLLRNAHPLHEVILVVWGKCGPGLAPLPAPTW